MLFFPTIVTYKKYGSTQPTKAGTAKTIESAIKLTIDYVKGNVCKMIEESVEEAENQVKEAE